VFLFVRASLLPGRSFLFVDQTIMPETRAFRLSPHLFYNVVLRQAGTLQKAILEAVMNSVDARATKCQVEITENKVTVKDNGQGFRSRAEIEKFWETFGSPPEEGEKKTYGQFRIGRGQCLSFGVNTWRSGTFRMLADVKNRGMDYELHDGLPPSPGCQIEIALYDPLLPSALEETKRCLERWVMYAPIRVKINGQTTNKDPGKQKWDLETDDAYIRFMGGDGIAVYNLGIYVFDLSRWHFGTGGVIVSKRQLKVNFARNDIMDSCPVWQRIKPLIDMRTTRDLTKKKVLDDDGRAALIKKIVDRKLALDYEQHRLKLITAVSGRHYPLSTLYDTDWAGLSVAVRGHVKAARVHLSKMAFVIASDCVSAFGVSNVADLLDLLEDRNQSSYSHFDRLPVLSITELMAGMTDDNEPIPNKQLSGRERVWLRLIEHAANKAFEESRKYVIGKSDTAAGWTDAISYVAVNRTFLREQDFSLQGFDCVGALILHELCHNDPDITEHEHDQDFYERFHDRVGKGEIGKFVDLCLAKMPKAFEQEKRRMDKRALWAQDKLVKVERTDTTALSEPQEAA
jgi:hypothetical protein